MVTQLKATLAIDAYDGIGEGPAWDGVAKRFLWLDNAQGIIHEAKSDGRGGWRETRRWNLGRRTGAAIPRTKGGLVVIAGTDVLLMNDAGDLTPFARIDADPNVVGLNDAKCDPRGRLWSGTVAHDFTPKASKLYRIDPDGSVTTMLDGVSLSNGLDWSPDGGTLYYIDSGDRTVDALDFDMVHGTIGRRRTLVEFPRGQGPDGMTVDREGCLWVAVFGPGEVRRYAPDGSLVACVAVSAPATTSCAFGGADGGDLFITSASIRLPEELLPMMGFGPEMVEKVANAPGAGGVFCCRPGATGKPATPFAG